MIESTEKDLATATAHWLEFMTLSGYGALFSESVLIIPIAEYLRGKQWAVGAEVDCYKLLGMNKTDRLAGNVNYDIHARRGEGNAVDTLILEMKFMKEETPEKKASPNYSRLIVDFVKLAIPGTSKQWKRLAFVARHSTVNPPKGHWLSHLENDEALELQFKSNGEDENVSLESSTFPVTLSAADKTSISNKMEAYEIACLGLKVTRACKEPSVGSVKVFVFSVERIS